MKHIRQTDSETNSSNKWFDSSFTWQALYPQLHCWLSIPLVLMCWMPFISFHVAKTRERLTHYTSPTPKLYV